MSIEITDYTVLDRGSYQDKGMTLQGHEFCRKLSVGAGWTELCVGVVLSSSHTGNITVVGDAWRIGLTTNEETDINGTSPHWVGASAVAATYSLTSLGGGEYVFRNVSGAHKFQSIVSRNGTVGTRNVPASGAAQMFAGKAGYNNFVQTVVFKRVSTSEISVHPFVSTDTSTRSPTLEEFANAMISGTEGAVKTALQTALQSSFYGTSAGTNPANLTGIDEAVDGDLNSLSFIWAPTLYPLTVHAIMAVAWS